MRCRYRLLPDPDNPKSVGRPVMEAYLFFGIWIRVRSVSQDRWKAQWKAIDAYRKLSKALQEEKEVAEVDEARIRDVLQHGDRGDFTGRPFTVPGSVLFHDKEAFTPDPGKAFSRLKKALERTAVEDPDNMGAEWPILGDHPDFVPERTGYVLAKDYTVAMAYGLGQTFHSVLRFRKPDNNQNNQKGRGKQQNQNQGGQNNNSKGGN